MIKPDPTPAVPVERLPPAVWYAAFGTVVLIAVLCLVAMVIFVVPSAWAVIGPLVGLVTGLSLCWALRNNNLKE